MPLGRPTASKEVRDASAKHGSTVLSAVTFICILSTAVLLLEILQSSISQRLLLAATAAADSEALDQQCVPNADYTKTSSQCPDGKDAEGKPCELDKPVSNGYVVGECKGPDNAQATSADGKALEEPDVQIAPGWSPGTGQSPPGEDQPSPRLPSTVGGGPPAGFDIIDDYTGAVIGTMQQTQSELPNLPAVTNSNPQTYGAPPSGQVGGDTSPLSPPSPGSSQTLDTTPPNESVDYTSGPEVGYGEFAPPADSNTTAPPDEAPLKTNNAVEWSGAGVEAPSTFAASEPSQIPSAPTPPFNVLNTLSNWWSYLKGLL